MRHSTFFSRSKLMLLITIQCLFLSISLVAQQTKISDFVLFGGKNSALPGYAVQLGSSSNVQGGSVGSFKLIKSTGSATINANIASSTVMV